MKILFTKNSTIVSKVIRSVTKEPMSHVALEFDIGIVVHSNFKGLHISWANKFKKDNTVVFEIEKTSDMDEKAKLDSLLTDYESSWYDIGAFLYLGMYMLLNKIGIKLPKKNLWQTTGMFLCTEWVSKYIDGKENSMITPGKLKEDLLNG